MKKILNSYSLYNNSLVVGPDINHVRDCVKKLKTKELQDKLSVDDPDYWINGALKLIQKTYYKLFGYNVHKKHACKAFRYLKNVVKYSKNALNALTWHQYYLNGHTCTLKDFLNVTVLETLKDEITQLNNFLVKKGIDIPIWLGETSSAYGGGAPGLSDRYVAGFLWLDKLGMVAALNKNYQVVIRQTFYHGNYALIGTDLYPNPDYWVSVLYKRLVSENVIRLKIFRKSNEERSLRLYAHCARLRNSVTIFGLNLSDKANKFIINTGVHSNFRIDEVHHYILSANQGNLTDRSINLNGHILNILNNDFLPPLTPLITYETPNSFQLPAYGMGFWVFINSTNDLC